MVGQACGKWVPPDFKSDPEGFQAYVKEASNREGLAEHRLSLLRLSASIALEAGNLMQIRGAIIGSDRTENKSPFHFGSDEAVGVALLLRIFHQLCEGVAECFKAQLVYAASSMLRQMVEVEYLAWAIENRSKDAERWLRSSSREREKLFKPSKLRRAAGESSFRSVDYSFHCEHGGHPTPSSILLLDASVETTQIMLADALGHAGRIWDHIVRWAEREKEGILVEPYNRVLQGFVNWKSADPLAHLGPPPLDDI